MTENSYIKAFESVGRISELAIRNAIKFLNLKPGCSVLDVPCGTGAHSLWMLEEYPEIKITCSDISSEHVEYATKKLKNAGMLDSCEFVTADMNKLKFAENSFDLVWCCDGLWPGTREMGCPAEEPYEILKDLIRIVKPGGEIAILFWSSQKLLPGYPYLEAKLNATRQAIIPTNPEANPELHFMRTPAWLKKTKLSNIQAKTFVADIVTSPDDQYKEGLFLLFDIFWGRSEAEVPAELWKKYKEITNPKSDEFILNQPGYAGLLTYTMYSGAVQ